MTELGVDIKLIKKFIQKKCNYNEHELVLNWLTHFKFERKLKHVISEHWDEIKFKSPDYDLDTDRFLDKLHHVIHLDSYKKSLTRSIFRKIYQQFSKIAAILLLPVLIISTWYFIKGGQFFTKEEKPIYAEIFSPITARTRFELPDGLLTIIWMKDAGNSFLKNHVA